MTRITTQSTARFNNLLLDSQPRRWHRLTEQREMETWQKYHPDRTRSVENSQSLFRREHKVRRISTRSSLARPAHIYPDRMDAIAELRGEMMAGIAEIRTETIAGITGLRAEMTARFEQVGRRLDESLGVITQQFVELRAYTDFAYEKLDNAIQSLGAGITRLERKVDRI